MFILQYNARYCTFSCDKGLVYQDFVFCPQVKLFYELGKIEGSLQELSKMNVKKDVGQYSIEIVELF